VPASVSAKPRLSPSQLMSDHRTDPLMARLATVFTGLMHLQILTGVATLFSRPFYTQMIGHFFLMLLAAAVAQFTTSVTKRRPPDQRSYGPHLVGALAALALVAAGTMAIGRGVLQSTM